MTAKNINAIDLVSRALAGMRMADEVPTMPREVIAYLAPFAHLSGDNDAVSFLVEAMQAEAEDDGWIPVSERLPEKDDEWAIESIWVDAKSDTGNIYHKVFCYVGGMMIGKWCFVKNENIIAWRPMRGEI